MALKYQANVLRSRFIPNSYGTTVIELQLLTSARVVLALTIELWWSCDVQGFFPGMNTSLHPVLLIAFSQTLKADLSEKTAWRTSVERSCG